jgi:6-phosphogluconolactonase/glucosamine-6-phosphate isomerase/deaminase
MHIEILEPDQWARSIATRLADLARASSTLRLCLATGSTPQPVYAELARVIHVGDLNAAHLELTLLDEFGGLSPDDPGRCAAMIQRDFLEPAGLHLRDVERFDPDAFDPGAELERFRDAVQIGFDLCILGIGLNGHLGMNEPGSPEDAPTRRVELHTSTQTSASRYGVKQTPTWGVTIGMKELLASSQVWLLATGTPKADIVKRALEDDITAEVPASVLRRHPNATAFLDSSAAALLNAASPKGTRP